MSTIYKIGNWVRIKKSKKAHRLVQGYPILSMACKRQIGLGGVYYSLIVEPDEVSDGSSLEKCAKCLLNENKIGD